MAKDYFKQVDEYVDGELTGSELSDFIKEMNKNPELSKEVDLYRKLNKQLYKLAENKNKLEVLKQIHDEFMKSRDGKKDTKL